MRTPPLRAFGLKGGADAKPGHNYVVQGNGQVRDEPGKASLSLRPDEIIVVETPGGGGWGRPAADTSAGDR